MSDEGGGLLELASSISDGVPIDWDQLEPDVADEALRRRQASLRVIATVAKIHRGASADTGVRELQFWGRLEIRQRIGRGAFGSVYRAWDPDLQREVALKLASSGAGRQAAAMNEARALARVRHNNVVTIHGVDRYEDRVGLWMDLIRGRTLERILNDQGPLGGREAALVGIEVCRALAAVHAKQLVHGDVKAQNVMREEGGRIVLMDFGLVRKGTGVSTKQSTRAGTPAYMAPELRDGGSATVKSDIYAAGVLLYYLVTAQFPSAEEGRDTGPHVASAKLLHDLRPDLPENLVHIIERALAVDPDDRFSTAGEMMRALSAALGSEQYSPAAAVSRPSRRRLLVGVGIAALLAAAVLFIYPAARNFYARSSTLSSTGSTLQRVSITVLPFENLSADPGTDYLCEGIADDVTSSLIGFKSLRVVPGTRASHPIGPHEPYTKLAQDLGVNTMLAGNFSKSGKKVRVAVQLIDARSNSLIWSQSYETDAQSISGLQAEISRAVLIHIAAQFGSAQPAEIRKRAAPNPQAYESYLYGRYLWKQRNSQDLWKAISYFKKAVAADSGYAPAYSGLADCYSLLVDLNAVPAREGTPPAKQAALKALQLDESLAEAHASLGFIRTSDWDWKGAEQSFARAFELDPENAQAHSWYARLLRQIGELDGAILEGRRAVDLDRTSLSFNTNVGAFLYYDRRYDEAEKQLLKTLDLDPNYPLAHFWLGWIYLHQGKFKDALSQSTIAGGAAQSLGEILAAATYAESGRRAEAQKIMGAWEERDAHGSPMSPFSFALVYSTLKNRELTYQWLERAYEIRDTSLLVAQTHPAFDWLRSEPRFIELFRRIGLPYHPVLRPGA